MLIFTQMKRSLLSRRFDYQNKIKSRNKEFLSFPNPAYLLTYIPTYKIHTDIELFLMKPDLMVFKQEKLHFKPLTLLGAHYQLAAGRASRILQLYTYIVTIDNNSENFL